MLTCAVPGCPKRAYRARGRIETGLCVSHQMHWRKYAVPTAGFISSLDLRNIAISFMKEVRPTTAEVSAAIRIMRGPRHREGAWADRPAYRLTPLLHGRWNQRLPHLLVGRRKEPSLRSISMGLVHYHLANTIIGTRNTYSQYLAGASFYCRRSPVAPKGTEVLKGNGKITGYRLQATDFSTIGRTVLKAIEALGVNPRSREVADRVTDFYLEGLSAGLYHPQIIVPDGSRLTQAPGDHPLDHYLPDDHRTSRRFWHKPRRATGMIGRTWPDGLDLTPEQQIAQRLEAQRLAADRFKVQTAPAPDVGWIFNS